MKASFLTNLFGGNQTEAAYEEQVVPEPNIQTIQLLRAPLRTDPQAPRGGGDVIVEDGVLVPYREVSEKDPSSSSRTKNGEISVYVVREGDTLSQIAEMFDVSAKTVLWANDISNPSKIRPGDALIILPITGVRHVVKQGDTLASIAKKYSGDIADILAYNQLTIADALKVGDTVVIPDGTVAAAPAKQSAPTRLSGGGGAVTGSGSSNFTNPLPGGVRTQGIHGYNGVDLAAPYGTPVHAAAGGSVIVSKGTGWNGGYGGYVVIKHANGTQTLYAHLSSTAISVGATVTAGQVIGYVGSTGRSTGNHLHFEVRGAKNPF